MQRKRPLLKVSDMSTRTDSSSENKGRILLTYILNNLERGSQFHEDLFELFGTDDGTRKGLVGKWDEDLGDFETICWDWNTSNLKHITNLLYILAKERRGGKYNPTEFDRFYENRVKHSENILEEFRLESLIEDKLLGLYVMRYKKQFPALVLEIVNISWEKDRKRALLIEFRPIKYFILSPETWDRIKKKSKKTEFWNDYLQKSGAQIDSLLKKYSNMKQAIYGLLPLDEFSDKLSEARILFIKDVEKMGGNEVVTDNQIFWELFREFTGKSHEKGKVVIPAEQKREIYNIPINSLSSRNRVYKQELGVANTLCHLLLELFQKTYLDVEFGDKRKITSKETSVLKRNFLVSNVSGEEDSDYSECDYDYLVNLEELGIEKKILFNLTTGLWRKSHGKGYEEFIDQWKCLHFKIPSKHLKYSFFWYVTIPETEEDFFKESPHHDSFGGLVTDLNKEVKTSVELIKSEGDLPLDREPIVVCLPIFEPSRRTKRIDSKTKGELPCLKSNDYKKTLFYKTSKSYFSQIVKTKEGEN